MKLTVAMGLQFDNGRSSNMYALSIGHQLRNDHLSIQPIRKAEAISDLSPVSDPGYRDAFIMLTYNIKGFRFP